jgi:uncharacterized protein YeaO (DUF488 family)
MPIRTRRWDDPAEEGDGARILITRYRPRGVKKSDETWDQWVPNLGPSRELHAAVYRKTGPGISWSTYRSKYLQEMRSQTAAIVELARRVAAGEMITLLCSSHCVNENRCHRSVLRELIEVQAARVHPV